MSPETIGNRLFDDFKRSIPGGSSLRRGGGQHGGVAGRSGSERVPFPWRIPSPVSSLRAASSQIKIDVCFPLPVVLVASARGLPIPRLAGGHPPFREDIGLMRLLPGMTILCPPGTPGRSAGAPGGAKSDGPVYIRIGKKGSRSSSPGSRFSAPARGS